MKQTLPCLAANESNNPSLVRVLLQYGAAVNMRDCRKNTPIFDAIGQGHVDCVKEMLKAKDINLGIRVRKWLGC